MKKASMQFALLAWIFFCLTTSAWSQTRIKLNVVYPAVTGVMTALWTAAEAKAFQKYGLDVSLLYIPSAPQVVRVMLAGDSQITVTGGAAVVSANLSGADLVFIGGIVNVPAFYVMAAPEIKTIEELRGATVGVTRFGSSSDFAMRYVLQKHGLRPEKDVTLLQLGGHARIGNGALKKAGHGGDALLAGGFTRSEKWRAAIDQHGEHWGFIPAIGDRDHSLLHSSAPGRSFEFPARLC
jgi:ABC-type nitrate/sulfonate/bicarbonate transport system substrate-binding protein